MNNKKLILTLFGAALAGLWSVQASAGIIGYVNLTMERITEGAWKGGGRGEFKINGYASQDGTGITQSTSGIFGDSGGLLYASCIESKETVNFNESRWYAISDTLVGAPTHSGSNISGAEEALIEQVLTQKFGTEFKQPDTLGGAFDKELMKTMQSLLWDAALYDGLTGTTVDASNAWSRESQVEALINGLGPNQPVTVETYALLRVGSLSSGFAPATGQDFLTYLPKLDPSTGVPVPAPLLLFGTGLLGLYGTLRRRRA